jgi:hypothetical protein
VAVSAVVSNGWREILARVFARDISQSLAEIARFKIGEGGSSGGSPITPDATYTDLESEGANGWANAHFASNKQTSLYDEDGDAHHVVVSV